MNLSYLLPRLARRFMPEPLVRFLLLRGWVIQAGTETFYPQQAVGRYEDALAELGESLSEKRVMVFGYGGRFDIALALLDAGAAHVVLVDKFAPPDHVHNLGLLPSYRRYLDRKGNTVIPRPEAITLIQDDIREVEVEAVDIVLSNSVYEHLDDVEGITASLAKFTNPGGIHVHFIDLRDHFFKYPFEMLRFSETTWTRWLNPSSHHNRYRLWEYRRVFEACFSQVNIDILAREEAAFLKLKPHIRPEFISENLEEDAAALIRVIAKKGE
ncbi:MAG: hypothetical protein Kow002_00150 [Anaerolineales bacterium]